MTTVFLDLIVAKSENLVDSDARILFLIIIKIV